MRTKPRYGKNGLPDIPDHVLPVRAPRSGQAHLLHPHGARDDEVYRGAEEGHQLPGEAAGAGGGEGKEPKTFSMAPTFWERNRVFAYSGCLRFPTSVGLKKM